MDSPKKYDLKDRTAKFAQDIIVFAQKIPRTVVTMSLINQLVKSGTSIGANYYEADDAESSSDFQHKIKISKKEANETKYWLQIVITAVPELEKEARVLWQEAKELHLIFNAIIHKIKNKKLDQLE